MHGHGRSTLPHAPGGECSNDDDNNNKGEHCNGAADSSTNTLPNLDRTYVCSQLYLNPACNKRHYAALR